MVQLKSIKVKLILFFGILMLLICSGLGVLAYISSEIALSSSIDESLITTAGEAAKVVEGKLDTQINVLEAMANNVLIKSDNITLDEKLNLLSDEVKRSGHISMSISDLNGNIKSTDGENINISDREYFKKASSGVNAVSDPIVKKTDKSIVVCYAVPIKDGNNVKGVLVATCEGNTLSDITDDISFGKSSEAVMISSNGTVIANNDKNLVLDMYNYLDEAKIDSDLKSLAELIKQMIDGKKGVGEYNYKGVIKYMGFAPVQGTGWSLAITAPKSETMDKVNNLGLNMFVVSVLFLGISFIATLIIARNISTPIKNASEYLNVVATGDFTVKISDKLLKMKDETGILANAIKTMQESIKNMVKEVISESTDVSRMLININTEMDKLNSSIEGISATTQELSAATEETASSTEEMNATSTEIESAAESIAAKTQEGAITVNNINSMAAEIKQNAISSRENAVEIYGRTKNELQRAIEKSKAVYQINELSEAILEITSQTNLLALNAAIEAARAGEAGKGFAVVADEIRKLAEGSKSTVVKIQEVTKVILEAVKNLSSSSGEILEFIDLNVLKDYDYLVGASEQNSLNSASINDMVTDFSATSEELLASVQNMAKAINEISLAANDGAQGASSIAQEATSVSFMSNNVIKEAKSARDNSEKLKKLAMRFKV